MVRDENYYQVSGWMLTKLKLKSFELQAFAIIYGFSQDGHSGFTGSLAYLESWLGCSRRTAINVLAALVEKGLLLKESKIKNNQIFNTYRANLKKIEELKNCLAESAAEAVLPSAPAEQKAEEKAEEPKPKPKAAKKAKPAPKAEVPDPFDQLADEPELTEALNNFRAMRIRMKAPLTTAAKKLLANKLLREFSTNEERIAALETALLNGWKSVYPANDFCKKKTPKSYNYDNTGLVKGVDYL